ncbi:MAG: hypothetical protein CFE21_09935 [Bacteroidetes bacterium B1(2017)]|nr:MAG: hypothetical protein CFE21_09935 [Bacteroidetes bacterium B1(2017)]
MIDSPKIRRAWPYKTILEPSSILILNALFLVFYFLFAFFSPHIHTYKCSLVPNLNPWYMIFAGETDGAELPILFVGMPIYLGIGFLLTRWFQKPISILNNFYLFILYSIGIFGVFAHHYWVSGAFINLDTFLVILTILSLLLLVLYKQAKTTFSSFQNWVQTLFLFALFCLIGWLISSQASSFDYSFMLAPANKIRQGEAFGSFFMQYNLLSTYVFVAFQKLRLTIEEMKLMLIVIFSFYLLLYNLVAKHVFANKTFANWFMLCLLVVRIISITDGPVSLPQVSCLRLDLWVPLVFLIWRFGFTHILSSIGFSLVYMADDTWGLLYLALYLLILSFILFEPSIKKGKKLLIFELGKLILIPLIAITFHLFLFGTIDSAAGKMYANLHIGFLPIGLFSSFWIIAFSLPLANWVLYKHFKNKPLGFLLIGFACIQLAYFFGRSHEHNLLNISGIFLFILFLCLDVIYEANNKSKTGIYLGAFMSIAICLNFSAEIKTKVRLVQDKFLSGKFNEGKEFEIQITQINGYLKEHYSSKVLLISDADGYLNYKMGYEQTGFFAPFVASIYTHETAKFLEEKQAQGYSLIIYPVSYKNLVQDILSLNSICTHGSFCQEQLPLGLTEIKFLPNR